MNQKQKLFSFITFLFVFRIIISLVAEFGPDDEFQIYLIGLKSFTTDTWPYFGPDVVYSKSQIPGALQGLLIAIPLYILKIPEAPSIFLSFFTFLSFSFLAKYIIKRLPEINPYIVWGLLMTLPWSIYGTKIINPAYCLIFSIPFFISVIDNLFIYKKKVLNQKAAFLTIGLTTTCIMQLHLSWVLLLPFTGIVFLVQLKDNLKNTFVIGLFYFIGLLIGASTLLPTLINDSIYGGNVESNLVFNIDSWKNLPVITSRFFAFASYEIPYILGSSTIERLAVIKNQIWMTPFTIVVLIAGFIQVGLFIFFLFKKEDNIVIKKIKLMISVTIILLFFSFFFSIKGPSSHTFAMLMPLPIYFSFYAYNWLISKYRIAEKLLLIIISCGIFFHLGLGLFNYKHKSTFTYRDKINKAISEKDYTILGKRRPDNWGYGY